MWVDLKREKWHSPSGFILACIGSAVGIANIWRFPYIVGENGGGAFLIPFLLVVVCLGIILMMLEFAIGKYFQSSIVKSLEKPLEEFVKIGEKFDVSIKIKAILVDHVSKRVVTYVNSRSFDLVILDLPKLK